ncbi:MAG: autotransporter outer membrane beta-barrel domain-containing protein, partial [Treponema sp.]|nr:autotransporter outer membrane beta-barrel domain-containing protein [Treponema sp.]
AKKNGTIEAAFDLTGIDKLYATLGVAFTLASSDWWDANETERMLKLALGASYGITEAFKLSADFQLSKPKKGDMAMAFGVGANYAITDALAAVADFRFLMPNNDKDSTMSFLVGLNYACGSNASLGIGFQAAKALGDKTGTNKGSLAGAYSAYKVDALVWAVPIRASFWF